MPHLGFTELIALAVITLLVVQPKQLPHLARSLAKLINQFRHMMSEAKLQADELLETPQIKPPQREKDSSEEKGRNKEF